MDVPRDSVFGENVSEIWPKVQDALAGLKIGLIEHNIGNCIVLPAKALKARLRVLPGPQKHAVEPILRVLRKFFSSFRGAAKEITAQLAVLINIGDFMLRSRERIVDLKKHTGEFWKTWGKSVRNVR